MNNMMMTVQELAKTLRISLPTAYALTDMPGFPVVRIGRRKVVPLAGLHRWLDENNKVGPPGIVAKMGGRWE